MDALRNQLRLQINEGLTECCGCDCRILIQLTECPTASHCSKRLLLALHTNSCTVSRSSCRACLGYQSEGTTVAVALTIRMRGNYCAQRFHSRGLNLHANGPAQHSGYILNWYTPEPFYYYCSSYALCPRSLYFDVWQWERQPRVYCPTLSQHNNSFNRPH